MKNSKRSPGRIKEDDFVRNVVSDPAAPPDALILSGWVGKSSRAGYLRLYLVLELNEYFEIAETDIIHSHSLATEENSLGGSLLWVKRDAKLLHQQVTETQAQSEFLAGDIISGHLAQAEALPYYDEGVTRRRRPRTNGCTLACTVGIPCLITRGGPACAPTGPFDRNCCAITRVA